MFGAWAQTSSGHDGQEDAGDTGADARGRPRGKRKDHVAIMRTGQNGRRRNRGGPRPPQAPGGAIAPRQDYGPARLDNRQRGNAAQLLEKYKTMARDATQSGDRITAEYYFQYADHYFRVLNEGRPKFEERAQPARGGWNGGGEADGDTGGGDEFDGEDGGGERAREERPRYERPAEAREERPRYPRPDERPREERIREERPRDDRPVEAREERPRYERPDDRPREERPRYERPAEVRDERPRTERPRFERGEGGARDERRAQGEASRRPAQSERGREPEPRRAAGPLPARDEGVRGFDPFRRDPEAEIEAIAAVLPPAFGRSASESADVGGEDVVDGVAPAPRRRVGRPRAQPIEAAKAPAGDVGETAAPKRRRKPRAEGADTATLDNA